MENDASGVSTDDQVSNQDKIEGKEDVVSYDSHKKLLGQYKTTKTKMVELENQYKEAVSRLESIEKERMSKEEAKLFEAGEKDKIIELREQKIKELADKYDSVQAERDALKDSMTTSEKLYSFYEKLPGKIKRNEYLKHVPIDKIVIDPETGKVDEQSVDVVVNEFMKNYSDLVDLGAGKRLPGDAARGGSQYLPDNFKNLPLKDMRANMKQAVAQAKAKLGVN